MWKQSITSQLHGPVSTGREKERMKQKREREREREKRGKPVSSSMEMVFNFIMEPKWKHDRQKKVEEKRGKRGREGKAKRSLL